MSTFDWIALGLYFLAMVGLAVAASRATSADDFAVGSRQIPLSIVIASLASTYIGPGYSMGLANKGGSDGYIWMAIFLMFSLQTVLVGVFVAPKLRAFSSAYTIGDIIGERYGRTAKVITGVLSVALCGGLIGAIAKASGDIITTTTGLPLTWAIVIGIVIVIAYTAFGGIKAVIITDTAQFVVLSIAFVILLFMVIAHLNGMPQTPVPAPAASKPMDLATMLGLGLAFLLGETLIPPYANRALVARDSAEAGRAFIIAGLFSVAWFFLCVSIGVLGAPLVPGADNAFLAILEKVMPVGLYGIAIAALASIIMSSQSSLLNAAAVSFEFDIVRTFRSARQGDSKARVLRGQIFTVVIGVAAAFFALSASDVIDALLICYTLWAPTLVIPLVVAAMSRPGTVAPNAGLFAIVFGGLVTAVWEWVLSNPYGVPSIVPGVVANMAVMTVGWLMSNADTHVSSSSSSKI